MVNLTEKDKIEHFKRECLSMRYYRGMLQETNDKLEEIAVRLAGVSSPAFKEVVLENARNSNRETRILQLMMEEDELCHEQEYWEAQIAYVESLLNDIKNSSDRQLIVDLYVDKRISFRELANEKNYSLSSMHRKIKAIIKRAINKR